MPVIFPPVSARRTSKPPPSNSHSARYEIERQRRADYARRNRAIANNLKGSK